MQLDIEIESLKHEIKELKQERAIMMKDAQQQQQYVQSLLTRIKELTDQ